MIYVDDLPQGASATIFSAREAEGVGSTGAGKAMALAALGYSPRLQCVLSDDSHGRQAQAACIARGVDMLVDVQSGSATPHHLNIMDKAGGRYSIFLSNGPERPTMDKARITDAIAWADTIFLSLAQSSRELLPLLERSRAEVLVDLHDYDGTNPWYEPFIACADVIQFSDVTLSNPLPVVERLLAGRAQTVIVTYAEAGASIHTGDESLVIPACPAQMRDSNGAGDAFSVALWHTMRSGRPVYQAGRFAAAAAAFAVEDKSLFPARVGEADIESRAHAFST